ncbi:protein tesmin/TSO1-like CXC 5 isoform X1 [Coffea arabica]|uniref:Protein tesmin/TSO1-like CXC 5 isoform X1 n=2 Tax=Coffea arabica TaxID=13443 RepID=A0ABM4U7E1_COFAR
METEAKDSKFPSHSLSPSHSLLKRRIHRKSPMVKLETLPEGSSLPRKRKTSSLSLLYPPPRPPLAILPKIEFDDFKLRGEIPAKEKHCKCKQSSCVKMYCLCFASGKYCDGCSCSNCQNTFENEEVRQASIGLILQRNQKAFRTMVVSSPECSQDSENGRKNALILVRYIGCCCKRSRCIQGYCECYRANIICSKNCKCKNCKNSRAYEEISSKESKKFEGHENFLDSHKKEQLDCMLPQSWPQIFREAAQGPLNFRFRSLLAEIIQLQNLMEFCELLIVTSKAVNSLSDKGNPLNLENLSHEQIVNSSSAQMESQDERSENQGSKQDNNASLAQIDVRCQDSTSNAIILTERPRSPETLHLMRNEKDMSLYPDASSDVALNQGCYLDVYIEQEKVVLVKLRDFLNSLITSGKAKDSELLAGAKKANGREKFYPQFCVLESEMEKHEEVVQSLQHKTW